MEKFHRPGGLYSKKSFSSILGCGSLSPRSKHQRDWFQVKPLPLACRMAAFLLCPHKAFPLFAFHILLVSLSLLKKALVLLDQSPTLLWRRQWHSTPVLLPGKSHGWRSCSPCGRKELDMTEWLPFPFPFHALEKEMATHSSVLAWGIPGTEEPGRLQSMGSRRVGHDWATSLSLSCTGEGNGNPLQHSSLENPRDGGAWWLLSMGSHRVRHDWSDFAAAAATLLTSFNLSYLLKRVVSKHSHVGGWSFSINFSFPGGSDGKASACNAGGLGSIPGSGRSPGEGNGNPLQYSCLENSMDWGAW